MSRGCLATRFYGCDHAHVSIALCLPVSLSLSRTHTQRAIWWYGLLHEPGSTPVHAVNMVLNASTQDRIIKWCQARHVTELYVDQWSSADPAIQTSFEEFVGRADNASIDLQL